MNKKILSIIIVMVVLCCGCSNQPKHILEGYISAEEYWDEGFQDYTDYCKYYYDKSDKKVLENDSGYSIITDDTINIIKEYFKYFPKEHMMDETKYDFDIDIIEEGDYAYIEDTGNEDDYDENYCVYYYDISENVLYYIHHNN